MKKKYDCEILNKCVLCNNEESLVLTELIKKQQTIEISFKCTACKKNFKTWFLL